MAGLTGPINFDARGFRTDFNLDIIELKQEGLVKVTIKLYHSNSAEIAKFCSRAYDFHHEMLLFFTGWRMEFNLRLQFYKKFY